MSTWSRTPHAREVKTSAVFGHKTECGLVRSCQTFRDHQQREGGDDDWSKHCNRFGKQGQIGPDHWQAPRRGVKPYGRPAQGTVPVDWIGAGLNRASGCHLRPDEQLDLGPLMNRIRYSKEWAFQFGAHWEGCVPILFFGSFFGVYRGSLYTGVVSLSPRKGGRHRVLMPLLGASRLGIGPAPLS